MLRFLLLNLASSSSYFKCPQPTPPQENLRKHIADGNIDVAALCLAQLFISENLPAEAVAVLGECLGVGHDSYVHTKLGVACVLLEEFEEALAHYHTAIAIDGEAKEALEGLEMLEKGMRGEQEEGEDMMEEGEDDGY